MTDNGDRFVIRPKIAAAKAVDQLAESIAGWVVGHRDRVQTKEFPMTDSNGGAVSDRLRREAVFHDERFAANTRATTDPFYWAGRAAYDRYNALIASDVAGLSVLSYGCGPGVDALTLAERAGFVHGIDISPATVAMARDAAARRGLDRKCRFTVMNAEDMTFPSGLFDRVCGSGILHHLDLSRALPEISRVLKPGGRAIFIEPLGHNPIINWYRRRTPGMRTADEHPLLASDLAEASRHFETVSPEFYHLLVLGAAMIRNRSTAHDAFRHVLRRSLDGIDSILLAPRSPLRWAAWVVVLVFRKGVAQ